MSCDYVIVTPVRNEQEYIENTILSVVNQTFGPKQWVIVNDGSTDDTKAIIERYASRHNWITCVHRKDRGFRKSGGGVIEAFYDGYASLKTSDWEFIVKLDGDLLFGKNYFEKCFKFFNDDATLGIGGGTIFNLVGNKIIAEKNPRFHVRGATKIYRRQFWKESGGLLKAAGWDTLDEVKANMLGYKTYTFHDVPIFQLKVTGAADGNWKNAFKNGQGSYIAGYHPLFMAFKCFRKVIDLPTSSQAAGLGVGFIAGYLRRTGRINDKELIKYLRQQQLRRLLLQDSIWK